MPQKQNEIIWTELKRIAVFEIPLCIVLAAGLILAGHEAVRVLYSALFGAAFSLFQFYSIGRSSVLAAMQTDPARATRIMQVGFGRRYLFSTVYLLIVFASGRFDLIAGVAPLLFPKVILLIYHTVQKKGGN